MPLADCSTVAANCVAELVTLDQLSITRFNKPSPSGSFPFNYEDAVCFVKIPSTFLLFDDLNLSNTGDCVSDGAVFEATDLDEGVSFGAVLPVSFAATDFDDDVSFGATDSGCVSFAAAFLALADFCCKARVAKRRAYLYLKVSLILAV